MKPSMFSKNARHELEILLDLINRGRDSEFLIRLRDKNLQKAIQKDTDEMMETL